MYFMIISGGIVIFNVTTALLEQELQNINGGVILLIVVAIAKGIALTSASGEAGGVLGYGIYNIFN